MIGERDEARYGVLSNGMELAVLNRPRSQACSIGLGVKTGSRHETESENGLAHFLEHMLFKGTKRSEAAELTARVERAGGQINAYTSEDHTLYYATMPAAGFETALDVLSEMLCESVFEAGALEIEREVVLDEIAMYHEQPSDHIEDLISAAAWPGHSLGRPTTGTLESVRSFNRGRVLDFFGRHYHPGGTFLAFCGGRSYDEVEEAVERVLGDRFRSAGLCPQATAPWTGQDSPQVLIDRRLLDHAVLAIGLRTPGRDDPRWPAIRLISGILGEMMSSRLYVELREKAGLGYHIQTSVHPYEETGLLQIDLGLSHEEIGESLELIHQAIAHLVSTPIGPDEFQGVIRYLQGQLLIRLDSAAHGMNWLVNEIVTGRQRPSAAETLAELEAVTPESVQEILGWLWSPERLALAAIGNLDESRDWREALFPLRVVKSGSLS